jgi:uncharacterized protein (TIGR00730 family)
MKRICVFCGSSPGLNPRYLDLAGQLGQRLAQKGIGLVYGGASIGMMGRVARSALDHGGEVIGVIPKDIAEMEVAFGELCDLRIVGSMHERKSLMADLSDGFIAMPGGLGTVEEFFEVLTWAQLGFHTKPCGVLNICGYFDKLIEFVEHSIAEEFINGKHRELILTDDDPEALLAKMNVYRPPAVDKAKWALKMAANM